MPKPCSAYSMVSRSDFRALALSLPHAVEKPHFDRASFRVDLPRGKIFTTLPPDDATANLMLSRAQQDILCGAEPEIFVPLPNKWGEKGATALRFEAADAVTVRSALSMAWKHAAQEKYWSLLDDR